MKHSFKNLFMVVMILVSLIGSSIQTTPVNALGSLTKVTPLSSPTVASLVGVWSVDANNVFAVGYRGTDTTKLPLIYRGSGVSGANWTYTVNNLPTSWGNGEFNAVWGTKTNNDLNVFAVGTGGPGTKATLPMAFLGDGTTWTSSTVPLPVTFEVGFLYGVWGTSASNVYAVGSGNDAAGTNYPMVSHWNGSSWSSIGLDLPTNPDWHDAYLRAIWGSSATDIWAAGNGENSGGDIVPVLYHYNGTGWSPATRSLPGGWSNGYLYGIWGSSWNDIYAVGSGTNESDATVPLGYRYNGYTWTSYTPSLPSTSWESGELMSVWGVDANNIYAVGFGGNGTTTTPFLYRKTAGSLNGWTVSNYPPTQNQNEQFRGIAGYSATDVYVVGVGDNNSNDVPLIYHAGPDGIDPGPVTNLAAASGTISGSVNLSWTAPADDVGNDNSGPVDSYLVRYSSTAITNETEWDAATPIDSGLPIPVSYGNTQTMKVSGLTPGAQYYFAIRAQDEELNKSTIVSVIGTAADCSAGATWYIQGVGSYSYGAACDIPVAADYNGDGKDDIAVFRPSNSTWYIQGIGSSVYGTEGDIPVVADYNGDKKADIAVFRPSNSTWYIRGVGSFVYGTVGDIPVVADYNGDGKANIAVFRPTNSTWYIYGVGPRLYGTVGDIPVVADYNGDKKADIAVFRPSNSTWYIYGVGPSVYGASGDTPVVADYNGDKKADIAVFRPSNSTWYIQGVGPSVYGTVGDTPVVADYNGDKKADIAVFRH